jgi:hypothetical protein
MARLGGPLRKNQINELRALLPPKDSPYSVDHLSQAETDALQAALRDGFGDIGSEFQ